MTIIKVIKFHLSCEVVALTNQLRLTPCKLLNEAYISHVTYVSQFGNIIWQ